MIPAEGLGMASDLLTIPVYPCSRVQSIGVPTMSVSSSLKLPDALIQIKKYIFNWPDGGFAMQLTLEDFYT